MATDKELADAYRYAATLGSSDLIALADELDPPKLTWPDGMYAIVWARTTCDDRALGYYARRTGDEWFAPDGRLICDDDEVTKVEPLRVLADDEIAVKRQWVTCPATSWRYEAKRCMDGSPVVSAAAGLCNAYADALEAEEAQAKP